MCWAKKVLSIRVSGKERRKKVRTLLLDLAHFRNMLIILITKYKELYGMYPLHQSILYGLVARTYTGKYREEFEKVLKNIEKDSKLKELLEKLKAQKEKVDNAHLVQYVIRQVIKDFINFFKSFQSYRENPDKFKGIPKPPKPKKLRHLMNFSAEGNANTFTQKEDSLVIKLRKGKYLKVKLPKNFHNRVSSVRLKLFGEDLYVDVVYEQEIKETEPKGVYNAGIDIGLDEMLSVVSENSELKSFIVSGKEIKAFNQWFNKEKAKLRSQMDCLKNEIKAESMKIQRSLRES
ncbi:transposase [Hydrogenobacter thermophilus]|uniref:transposase n=1 Tax=Hydrogenobacter thermophilus TaxID=940 RepID=UPI0026EF3D6A|nr:transposase [Hydrogenobacter thermophilus]